MNYHIHELATLLELIIHELATLYHSTLISSINHPSILHDVTAGPLDNAETAILCKVKSWRLGGHNDWSQSMGR